MRRGSPESGTVLIGVLLLMVLLSSLSYTFLQDGLRERGDVDYSELRLRAREVAEIGLGRAEAELASGEDPDGDGLGTVRGKAQSGAYAVQCTADAGGGGRYVLVSRASVGLGRAELEAGVRTAAQGLFMQAMFGRESVSLTGGSHTDSYDSDKGTWLSQVTGTDGKGLLYANPGGHVGSNGDIVLSGPVRGDAIPGPLGSVDHAEFAWGSTAPRDEDMTVEDPPYAQFAAAFASNENLGIDVSNPKVSYDKANYVLLAGGGAPITLEGGTYIFNTLKMTGGGSLYVKGPCTIYITNYFEISGGGVVNLTGVPADCIIYAHPYDFPAGSRHDKQYVKTSGGSDTAFAVYAPEMHIETSGGGTFFGALLGNTVVFSGGSAFHYDEALGRLGSSGSSTVERTYVIERD